MRCIDTLATNGKMRLACSKYPPWCAAATPLRTVRRSAAAWGFV